MTAELTAAGGVVWRQDGQRLLVAVVHRSRYDDWSLPKGKLRPGEVPLLAAVREVREETGLTVVVGRRLPRTTYSTGAGVKAVDYWSMRAGPARFVPNREVDELRWLVAEDASALLSYPDDAALVADPMSLPVDTTVLLVRHARAGRREDWAGPDSLRPLDELGKAQAEALARTLPVFGPARVLSAPPLRCRQTVAGLAGQLGLPVEEAPEVGEGAYLTDPGPGRRLLAELLAVAGPTAVCSQGGVIPDLVQTVTADGLPVSGASLGSGPAPSKKGSVWVLAAREGRAISTDYYPGLLRWPANPAVV